MVYTSELVVGVKIVKGALFPVKDFFGLEESLQFYGCGFRTIGSVNDVFLETHAIGTANGSGGGVSSVGRACKCSDGSDGIHSSQAHGNDGRRHHGVFDTLEERFLAEVSIVLAEEFIGELHHLQTAEVKSFTLEDSEDFTNQPALQRAGFQQNECFFNSHGIRFKVQVEVFGVFRTGETNVCSKTGKTVIREETATNVGLFHASFTFSSHKNFNSSANLLYFSARQHKNSPLRAPFSSPRSNFATALHFSRTMNESHTLIIRRAVEADIPALLRLLRQISQTHHDGRPDLFRVGTKYDAAELRTLLTDRRQVMLVAEVKTEGVVGYALCAQQEVEENHVLLPHRTLYLDDLCVDKRFQNFGIGGKLLEAVKAAARENHCDDLTLNVWECNPRARAFYERHGFRPRKTMMEIEVS